MFLGHFAVSLAAKKVAPKTSLATLVVAAQFLDLLWPALIVTGVEHARIDPGNTPVTPLDFFDYPISHSLSGALVWSLLIGGVYRMLRRDTRNAIIVGACVASHWVLDLFSHKPDLPLWFTGNLKVGMGLWYSMAATLVVELGLFAGGAALYLSATRSRDRIGSIGLWGLLAFLFIIYIANLVGPPPPNMEAIGWAGNAIWLVVLWAWWVDRHREARTVPVVSSPEQA
jgi:hypothetical protein